MAVQSKASKFAKYENGQVKQRKRSREADAVDKAHSKKLKPDKPVLKQNSDSKTTKVKQSKKNATLIKDITLKWEKLRNKQTTAAQKVETVHEIMQQVQGRVPDLAMSHTASRVIQACAKHGNEVDRQTLLDEAAPRVVDLAKSAYGNFLLIKLITEASKTQFPGILKLFKGHVAQLLRHPCGTNVIDALYNEANSKQQAAMAAELYGREFVLFSGEAKRLPELMPELAPAKQKAVLRNLAQHAIPIMEKALVDSPLGHRMLSEYIAASPGTSVSEAVQLLAGPPLVRMVHTKEGAQVACSVIAYGTAKDRKKAIKGIAGLPDTVLKMAQDEWGSVVLMCILDTVDDTALLKKQILPDILNNLDELPQSKFGRRVLLQMLHPNCQKYVPLNLQQIMRPPAKLASGFDTGEGKEEVGDSLGGSKKDSEVRRQELLGEGSNSLAARLCTACTTTAADMLRDQHACDVIVEVAQAGSSGILAQHHLAGMQEVQTAIAQAAAPAAPAPDTGAAEHVLLSYFSTRAIRRLVISSSDPSQSTSALSCFPKLLWQAAFKGKCQQWLGTHAEKILAALANCQDVQVTSALDAELRPLLDKTVQQWAADFVQHGTEMSKASKERKRLNQKEKRQKDRQKTAEA